MLKNPPDNAGDMIDVGSIPELGRSPGEGHGNPLQYSCLENPMDKGAWRAAVHRVSKSQTQLKQVSIYIYIYIYIYMCVCVCVCICVCILFIFFPIMVYHKIWNIVPCGIQ